MEEEFFYIRGQLVTMNIYMYERVDDSINMSGERQIAWPMGRKN